jgi:hypothetical protein
VETVPAYPNPTLQDFHMDVIDFTIGRHHLCALSSSNQASCKMRDPFYFNYCDAGGVPAGWITPLGVGTTIVPVPLSNVTGLSSGVESSCFLHDGGKVSCIGSNLLGGLGLPNMVGLSNFYSPCDSNTQFGADIPVQVPLPTTSPATVLVSWSSGSCAQLADARIFCWGARKKGVWGGYWVTDFSLHEVTLDIGGVDLSKTDSAYGRHMCGVHSSGKIACWPSNEAGELGMVAPPFDSAIGEYTLSLFPNGNSFVPPWGQTKRIGVGQLVSCAISNSDLSVWCWGSNGVHGLGRALPTVPIGAGVDQRRYESAVVYGAFSPTPALLDTVLILS